MSTDKLKLDESVCKLIPIKDDLCEKNNEIETPIDNKQCISWQPPTKKVKVNSIIHETPELVEPINTTPDIPSKTDS